MQLEQTSSHLSLELRKPSSAKSRQGHRLRDLTFTPSRIISKSGNQPEQRLVRDTARAVIGPGGARLRDLAFTLRASSRS